MTAQFAAKRPKFPLCLSLTVHIMAYGSTTYVGMVPEKNGGHIKCANDMLEMSI